MFEDLTGWTDLVESGCFPDFPMGLVDAVLCEANQFQGGMLALLQVQRTGWIKEPIISRAKPIVT